MIRLRICWWLWRNVRRYKTQRACQIIANATGQGDVFYLDDDLLLKALQSYHERPY